MRAVAFLKPSGLSASVATTTIRGVGACKKHMEAGVEKLVLENTLSGLVSGGSCTSMSSSALKIDASLANTNVTEKLPASGASRPASQIQM